MRGGFHLLSEQWQYIPSMLSRRELKAIQEGVRHYEKQVGASIAHTQTKKSWDSTFKNFITNMANIESLQVLNQEAYSFKSPYKDLGTKDQGDWRN